jgi:Tfp pilus assembly protein PilV
MRLMTRRSHPESGMTLIELSIAGTVLVVGMLSIMGLLMVAIGNNGRSKIDSTATMLNQAVVEQISAVLAGGGPGTVVDNDNCDGTGNTWNIDTASGGATLSGNKIDFTQAQGSISAPNPPALYYMNYVECNNNVKTTYDVRWNIQVVPGSSTFLITVGAKPKNGMPTRFGFAIPVNMRVYVGG